MVRFAREYGWRAYAIPVLLVITVWILVDVIRQPENPAQDQSVNTTSSASTVALDPLGRTNTSLGAGPIPATEHPLPAEVGELPKGGPFTESGRGSYRVVGTPGAKVGQGKDKAITYVVEIEEGVDTVGYGGDAAVAAMVDATLANPKGWIADPAFSFQHVRPEDNPSMRIQLTSINTTHKECGHDLKMETSCFTSNGNRVVLNEARWVRGSGSAQGDVGAYRQYLINHEVGHGLGYAAHAACPASGELAPIMMQQTLSLNNSELHKIDPAEIYTDDQKACKFNPWPFPLS